MYDYILPSHVVGYVSLGIEFKNATVLVIGSSRNVTPSGSVGTFLSTHSLKYVIHTQSESNVRIRESYSFKITIFLFCVHKYICIHINIHIYIQTNNVQMEIISCGAYIHYVRLYIPYIDRYIHTYLSAVAFCALSCAVTMRASSAPVFEPAPLFSMRSRILSHRNHTWSLNIHSKLLLVIYTSNEMHVGMYVCM